MRVVVVVVLGWLRKEGKLPSSLSAPTRNCAQTQQAQQHLNSTPTQYNRTATSRRKFSIVPIVVGALSAAAEAEYGALLAPYLDDPSCLFVFSSDFCHWGRRFGYTYYDKAKGAVWQCVRWLDDLGIKAIETVRCVCVYGLCRRCSYVCLQGGVGPACTHATSGGGCWYAPAWGCTPARAF